MVWDGAVTWQEWQDHASALMLESNWKQSSRFLVDLRSVTNTSSINEEQVQQAQLLFQQNLDNVFGKRGAILATEEFRNAHDFARLIASTGISMVVFNGLDTACIFLGLDLVETNRELEQLRSKLRGE